MLIKKYIRITIKDNEAVPDDNLFFYKNDKNIDVMFELINFKFDFIKNQPIGENTVVKTNASYATLRIIKPNGEKLLVIRCPIEDSFVKFTVTPEFIDELEEVGIHQLQITLYDEFEGRITIPPISFEVLQPLFDDDNYEEGQVNITQANVVITPDEEKWINDLNGREEIFPGTNLFEWKHGDWISDIRLNAIHDNILRLNNIKSNQIGYGHNGLDTVQDALNTLLQPTLNIDSFNTNISTSMEIGITVNWCNFTWSYNKDIVSQRINNIELDKNITSYRYRTPFNDDIIFTLVAYDGREEKTKSITIEFCNRVFYGVALTPENGYDDNFLNNLKYNLQKTRNNVVTVNSIGNQYIYYASPSKYGECIISVNGFVGGFTKVATIQYVNPYGYKEDYYIYKSDNPNLGNTTMVIQ
ncbi:MAG: hypothetical protein II309_01380 [Bacilli bacterium]|nr:hypothetical protein [Bacilli bacterium]